MVQEDSFGIVLAKIIVACIFAGLFVGLIRYLTSIGQEYEKEEAARKAKEEAEHAATIAAVSYTHLRAHETLRHHVCRLLRR